MTVFDPTRHVAFNCDEVSVRHEMAHAAVWFHLGEGIGPLRLRRGEDLLLHPSVLAKQASERQAPTVEYLDRCAEKLLAGEVAARRFLHMPTHVVSIGDQRVTAAGPHWSPAEVASMCRRKEEDIVKVLAMAHQDHPHDWWDWLHARMKRSVELVELCWPTIEIVATRLVRQVPRIPGEQRVVWGTNLISWMYAAGLDPEDDTRHPIELIPRDHPGPCLTRVLRSARERLGKQRGSRLIEWRLDAALP